MADDGPEIVAWSDVKRMRGDGLRGGEPFVDRYPQDFASIEDYHEAKHPRTAGAEPHGAFANVGFPHMKRRF